MARAVEPRSVRRQCGTANLDDSIQDKLSVAQSLDWPERQCTQPFFILQEASRIRLDTNMLKNPFSPVQKTKDQAGRLQAYLTTQGVPLTRAQSLEGISRAIHGKPWNVVRAGLQNATPASADLPIDTSSLDSVFFTYRCTDGTQAPLALIASCTDGGGVTTRNVNKEIHLSSDTDLLALMQNAFEQRWLHLPGRREAHPSEAKGRWVLDTREERDSFALYIAAFRPHLLLTYLAFRFVAHTPETLKELLGVCVEKIAQGSGGWQVCLPTDASSVSGRVDLQKLRAQTHASQEAAELALCQALLAGIVLPSSSVRWLREDLATLNVVAGSGEAEEVSACVPVAGRHDHQTPAPLVLALGQGPLPRERLKAITNDSQHYLDVVLQVEMDMLLDGLDAFLDTLSERITGSTADLEDIGYEAAPMELELDQPQQNHIWLRIVGNWQPMDNDDEDELGTEATQSA